MTDKNDFPLIQWIDRLMFALAVMVGPWLAPLANGIIFGWALIDGFDEMGKARYIAGAAAGVGVVVAGAISSHVVMHTARKEYWLFVYGYISLEIAGLVLMGILGTVWGAVAVGIVIALMTLIVYLSRAALVSANERLAKEAAAEIEARQIETDQKAYERKHLEEQEAYERKRQEEKEAHDWRLKEIQIEQEHAQKIAQIEASKEAKLAQATVRAAQAAAAQVSKAQMSNDHLSNGQSMQALRYFSQGADGTKSGLAQYLNIARNTASKRVDDLTEQGLLSKSGSKWSITAQGLSMINEHLQTNGKG